MLGRVRKFRKTKELLQSKQNMNSEFGRAIFDDTSLNDFSILNIGIKI